MMMTSMDSWHVGRLAEFGRRRRRREGHGQRMESRGAVLFDLDGTLVDTLPDLLWAMNALMDEMGRRPIAAAELRGWIGDGVAALVKRALEATGGLADASAAAAAERYLTHYASHVAVESRAYPSVAPALQALRSAGYRLGVCTNKPTRLAVAILESLGLIASFAAVVGGDSVAARKPDAEHIFATLRAMDAGGGKRLMVGDSGNDVAAARHAAIPVVVVSYGYAHGAPADLGADAVIDDFAALPTLVEQIL